MKHRNEVNANPSLKSGLLLRLSGLLLVGWLLGISSLLAQPTTMSHLMRLVATPPARFEQAMITSGYTCYQRRKTISDWRCFFMDQRPAYLNQPALSARVIEYIFGPNATVLVWQTKSAAESGAWPQQLAGLGFTTNLTAQPSESVGQLYTSGRVSVILRKVDSYNGIASGQTGYSASITWMRQPLPDL